jgi:NADH-quinone oxidoreductase E subunit
MFSEATEERFKQLRAAYPQKRSALVPMLILAQKEQGWVTPEAMAYVADYLDLSAPDVESVVSFYTLLNRTPVGQHTILVCTNLSCMLCGSDEIQRTLEEKLQIEMGETTSDQKFTVIEAECLGSCTTAPVLQVNGEFHENLNSEKVEALLSKLQSGQSS